MQVLSFLQSRDESAAGRPANAHELVLELAWRKHNSGKAIAKSPVSSGPAFYAKSCQVA
jgi:hypothetical protein